MQKVRRAVFPVAGFGTRFLPVTKSQPKEMLPIVDKPVIHYLVEEAVNSGIEEIIIVTGRGKRAIEDYFDQSFELEHNLVERGKHDLLAEVLEIPNMAKFIYVRQSVPRGDGDAILQAYSLLRGEPFAVMFGDELVRGEVPALKQLIEAFEVNGEPVVALSEVSDKDLPSYGVVEMEDEYIKGLVEKPRTKKEAPSNFGIIGKYIVTPEVLECLHNMAEGFDSIQELRLADGLKSYIANGGKLVGKVVKGERYDTGNKIGLIKATIDFALARDELADELTVFLKSKFIR